MGDVAGAQAASEKAKKFAIWSAITSAILLVVIVVLYALFFILLASSSNSIGS